MKYNLNEFMKTADIIIKNGGRCDTPKHLHCVKDNCPAWFKDASICLCRLRSLEEKLQWFINWKKENEVKEMSEKIQMTEEQFIDFMLRICSRYPTESETTNAKHQGIIRKSQLQQKVEEVERAYDERDKGDEYLIELQHSVIQLFKEDYPEFKS